MGVICVRYPLADLLVDIVVVAAVGYTKDCNVKGKALAAELDKMLRKLNALCHLSVAAFVLVCLCALP